MSALAAHPSAARLIGRGQDTLAIGLRAAGWSATTLMATLGVVTLFFFVLGSFTVDGTMLQLDNLTSRYLAANDARQAQFQTILFSTLGIAFALIGVFRRSSLRAAFRLTGDDA